MLQLASDCNHAKKDFITCRNEALMEKPELWKHYGFMHDEFKNYYTWTSRIVDDPAEIERIHNYYDRIINS
jgi:hypothetical protein